MRESVKEMFSQGTKTAELIIEAPVTFADGKTENA